MESLPKLVAQRCSTADRVRRGACLLNAAQYDQAIAELSAAAGDLAGLDNDPFLWFLADDSSCLPTIDDLRGEIAADAENPCLHFQLGIRLALAGRLEEAELRFTQTLSINRDHADALVCLGLCRHIAGELDCALGYLQRAQALRPDDARISLLLAKTASFAHRNGAIINLCAAVSVF